MKFFKKASTSSPPRTELKEEVPKKIPVSIIKKIFSFERLEMRFLWWIFLVSLIWGLYFISPLSKPKGIYVYGNRQVAVETIQEQAGIKKGKSIWEILSEHEIIRKRLTSRNPKIKDVSVTLSGMNSIQLTILEKELNAQTMLAEIDAILVDSKKKEAMAASAKKMGITDASVRLTSMIHEMI